MSVMTRPFGCRHPPRFAKAWVILHALVQLFLRLAICFATTLCTVHGFPPFVAIEVRKRKVDVKNQNWNLQVYLKTFFVFFSNNSKLILITSNFFCRLFSDFQALWPTWPERFEEPLMAMMMREEPHHDGQFDFQFQFKALGFFSGLLLLRFTISFLISPSPWKPSNFSSPLSHYPLRTACTIAPLSPWSSSSRVRISSAESSHPNTSLFSSMRCGLSLLGSGIHPFCNE